MNWAVIGLVYAAGYAAAIAALDGQPHARLILGNVALLVPPTVLPVVVWRRRHDWLGRQSVFFAALASWATLWLVGQIAWFITEVGRGEAQPWFHWYIVPQLCGSALPLIAMVA